MKIFVNFTENLSKWLNGAACVTIFLTMVLIVVNILLRGIFKLPILGTYEYVGYLSAVAISLALAHCGITHGHIAVDFLVTKLSKSAQFIIRIVMKSLTLIFLFFVSWHIFSYGLRTLEAKTVSTTTQVPLYPFIFITALGLLMLSFAIIHQILFLIKERFHK
jgi:TRAP-type C4-dicarboxylate transport system permease small subunit